MNMNKKKTIHLAIVLALTSLLAADVYAEPGVERPEKNAFNKKTNQTIVFDGISLSVPEYLSKEDKELSTEENRYYYAENGEAIAFFETMYTDLDEALSEAEFLEQMDEYDQGVISTLDNPKIQSTLNVTVAGYPGRILHVSCKVKGKKLEGYFTYFLKDEEDRVIFLSLCQTDNTEFDYFSDYFKIIATARREDGTDGSSASTGSGTGSIADTGTVGEQNALASALDALNNYAFSYSGLISALRAAGYSETEAVFAADHCGADWNEQAVKAALENLALSAFTRDTLIEQLQNEGFTYEEAVYGAEQNGYVLSSQDTAPVQDEMPAQEDYYEEYYPEETYPEEDYYIDNYVEEYPSDDYYQEDTGSVPMQAEASGIVD